jgi:competence protein ComGC
LKQSFWRRLWKQEAGFSLIEAVAATFIAGTVVVGSVVVMGTAARTAGDTGKNLDLQQFVQAQIETIQNSPYSAAGDYPSLTSLPEQVTVEIAVSDAGTNYTYPSPDGSMVNNVVQRILVTACEGADEEGCPEHAAFAAGFVSMTVYKIEQ